MPVRFPLLLLVLAGLTCGQAAPDFAKDIRPILERSCYGCHGSEKQKSGYRLDVREVALKGGSSGERAIVPHNPKSSLLVKLIRSKDEDERMPPVDNKAKPLSKKEIRTIEEWIKNGPSWPDEFAGSATKKPELWSLKPLKKPPVPNDKVNPIDAFVRAKLKEAELNASPLADPRTLARRLYYNLTGLPPTPDQLEAFVADKSSDAYEQLVERLLASPRYGEHWARHWLDVAHYADTHGNDHDFARPNAWPYRDWVVNAFNNDKPYRRFVKEQVAGDVLYPDDPQALVALGFLAAGPWDETLMVGIKKDTVDHRMAQNLDRDDYVATVMGTFQSLTVQCARCHDHKFDPISQKEYYQLQAVFSGIDRVDREYDLDRDSHVKRRRLGARLKAITSRDKSILDKLTPEHTRKVTARLREEQVQREKLWQPLDIISIASAFGADWKFGLQEDGTWLASGPVPQKDTYILTARINEQDVRAIRLETLPHKTLPGGGPGRFHPSGNFHFTEFNIEAHASKGPTKGARPVKIDASFVSHSQDANMKASHLIDGNTNTHWSVHPHYGKQHNAVFRLAEPLGHDSGTTLIIRMQFNGHERHLLGRFRLSYCTSKMPEPMQLPLSYAMNENLAKSDPSEAELREIALQQMEREVKSHMAKLPQPELVYAVHNDFKADRSFTPSPDPRPIHVLVRGEVDKHGELVEPGTIGCVPEMPAALNITDAGIEANRRAALALWLADSRNVLTWRSIVNRIWHYHFGRGLCRSPNDFGRMGATPSHPELLDWLAVWFRDEAKGSFKKLHRLIVTSKAYRQSVVHDDRAANLDPRNELLWRMNRMRLTGEQLRDTVVHLSGRLDLTMGGPTVYHFNHKKAATFMPSGGQPAYIDYENFDPDNSANNRRALYRFIFRTLPDPLMRALDVPDGDQWVPSRAESTTSIQAFALLNNPFVIRMAEQIAKRIKGANGEKSSLEDQVEDAFRLVLLRETKAMERTKFSKYTRKHGLANTVHLLLNSNEFIYVD